MRSIDLDVIGGIGTLQQRAERLGQTHFPGDIPTETNTIETHYTSAFALGLDVPIAVGTHLMLLPVVRVYWLRRNPAMVIFRSPSDSTKRVAAIGAGIRW